MSEGWTARALADLTGTPPTTLASWMRAGLVSAERTGVGRSGHTIGVEGLLEILAVRELRAAGFSLRVIGRAVDTLRTLTGEGRPLARLTLVVRGEDIVWRDGNDLDGLTVSALRQPGQRLMVFPLGETHGELAEQLAIHPPRRPVTQRPSAHRTTGKSRYKAKAHHHST